jgi:hypothetical protein
MSSDNSDSRANKDLFWEKLGEAIKEIKEFPEKKLDAKITLDDYYDNDLIPFLLAKGFKECQKIGYILFCKPCPYHSDNQHDVYYIDLLDKKSIERCAKDPQTERENKHLTPQQIVLLRNLAKEVTRREIIKSQTEIIVRNYLSNNYIISLKREEKYAIFKYMDHRYVIIGKEVLKGELQQIHEKLFGKENPPETMLNTAILDIAERSVRGSDMSVFDNDDGITYYIPFQNADLEVNRKTGAMRILEKDPVNRPFTSVLKYNINNDYQTPMPRELEELLSLVPPSFRETLLFELVSPLGFLGTRRIYVNFSRVGSTGKTTLLHRIEELYEDLVVWSDPSALGERFERSSFIGKSVILIDEYDSGGVKIKSEFKKLASNNSLRVEVKHGPILNIKNRLALIVNSNSLRFDSSDLALLSRLVIVPFIKNFDGSSPVDPWDKQIRERIINWLIKNILPRYFVKEPKKYPINNLIMWTESARKGEHPYHYVDEFLRNNAYDSEVSHGILMPLREAYEYYLLWTDEMNYLPVSFEEFVDQLEFLFARDGKWLIEKNNEKMICMKKANLNFFMNK